VASSPSQHTRTVIFRAFPFSAPPLSLPTFFSYFSLFSFQPPLPFPKEVNKKRSYRGQNALSEIKTHECNNDNEHILYLSVSQSPLAGRIMFSTCPFVCYQLNCERYTSKTNKPILKQMGINLPRGKGMNGRPRRLGRSRSQEAELMFGSLVETSFSTRSVE